MKSAMENSGETSHQGNERKRERYVTGTSAADATVSSDGETDVLSAGAVASQNFVTLPSWFPIDKASAVLRLKGKPFALLSDERGVAYAAHLDRLAEGPAEKGLLWCASPLGTGVAPSTPIDEALRQMSTHANSFVPIVQGGVVLGVLSRHAAVQALALPRTGDDVSRERLAA